MTTSPPTRRLPGRAATRIPAALAIGGLLIALAGAPAAAAPPAPPPSATPKVDAASERFERGVRLYKERRLEAALAEFQRAYELAPTYQLHYNIGQIYLELRNDTEAMRAFWKYLAAGGGRVGPERTAEVRRILADLETRVVYLTIAVNTPGARVAIDDVPVGIAPLSAPILVNPGERRVSAVHDGYAHLARRVTAAGGERPKVELELSPIAAAAAAPRGPVNLSTRATPRAPSRPKLLTSLAVTAALAAGAGLVATLAGRAESDFEAELATVPNTRAAIDDARARMKRLALLTDVLVGGAVVAGGLSLYFGFTESGTGGAARVAGPSGDPGLRFGLAGQF